MTLGEWLSRKGLSQQAFADASGVSQGAIAKFVLGQRLPNRQTMRKIVEATEGQVTPNDFHNIELSHDASNHEEPSCPASDS